MWKTAITCWIWNAVTHSVFSAKAWGEISNRSKLDHNVTVTFTCHIISHFPTAISKTSIGLTAWMAHHKKEKRLQLIPCACHPDYQQGDHEVEDDPVAADGSAGTGFCAAACNSTKSTEVWKMRIQSFTMVSACRDERLSRNFPKTKLWSGLMPREIGRASCRERV